MRIFTEQTLKDFANKNPSAKTAIQEWVTVVKKSDWKCFADIKETFNREIRETLFRVFPVTSDSERTPFKR